MRIILLLFSFVFSPSLFAQHTPYWNHKVSMYSLLPNNSDEIIFLGDSNTDRCEWSELLANPAIKNRGLSGDRTAGVLDRLSEITESHPVKVFLQIGANDLRHNINLDTIIANYKNIVEKIKSESPQTEIILQSAFPVNNNIGTPKTVNWKINLLNEHIKSIAKQYHVPYVDIHSHLTDDEQQLNAVYSEDGLHINGKGYLVWKSLIQEYVNN